VLETLFNTGEEIGPFEGKTYTLRQPTILEELEYAKYLRGRAVRTAEEAGKTPEQKERLVLAVLDRAAAGVYDWGGEVWAKSVQTTEGLAKLLSIVMADQGVTEPLAKKLVAAMQTRIAATIFARLPDADPKALAQVGADLTRLGLPSDFLSGNWQTPRSVTTWTTSLDAPASN